MMNEKDPDIDQDKDYQALHEQYQQGARELPTADMDASILQAAHRAIENDTPHTIDIGIDTQPVKRAWYVPVSYVAILVISLSVVMKVAFEPELAEDSYQPPMSEMPGLPDESRLKSVIAPASAPEKASKEKQSASRLLEQQKKRAVPVERSLMSKPALPARSEALGAGMSADVSIASSAQPVAELEEREQLPPTQQERIEQLLLLFKQQDFKALESALEAYRKDFPLDQYQEQLPAEILAWEQSHTGLLPKLNSN